MLRKINMGLKTFIICDYKKTKLFCNRPYCKMLGKEQSLPDKNSGYFGWLEPPSGLGDILLPICYLNLESVICLRQDILLNMDTLKKVFSFLSENRMVDKSFATLTLCCQLVIESSMCSFYALGSYSWGKNRIWLSGSCKGATEGFSKTVMAL